MTAVFLRRTGLFSRHSSFVCKSQVALSVLYCTASGKQPLKTLTVSEFLMHNHHFSPEYASRVGSVLSRFKNYENADLVLSFLKESGLSIAQLEKTVKNYPNVLSANLEGTIKPKIRIFQDSGFSAAEIADIVSGNVGVLRYSTDIIVSALSVLQGLQVSNVDATNFFRMSVHFGNLEKTLVPNIEFMKSCGVPVDQITWIIRNDPTLFLKKPETMRKLVEKIDEMGLDRSSGMFIHAVRVVSRMTNETWELKLKTLRLLGFSENDILRVFRYAPMVFGVLEEKMKKVAEVLLETGKYDISCIIYSPTAFMYSIEKRYRPRLQVLRVLEKKNLINKWPALRTLHTMTDAKFFQNFVAPYTDEVGKLWSTGRGRVMLEAGITGKST